MPVVMLEAPTFLVVKVPGINREIATQAALEVAGARADIVPVRALASGEIDLTNYQGVIIPGGFSYGDDIQAGVVLATDLRTRFADQLQEHVQKQKPVVAICNGFQAVIQLGLLPYGEVVPRNQLQATLTTNDSGRFESRWVDVQPQKSVSKYVPTGNAMTFPVAHGEGKFVVTDKTLQELEAAGQIVWRYSDDKGNPTQEYPTNPNGSLHAIAGITDKSGVIFGAMPHPEDFIIKLHHPNWRRRGAQEKPDGLRFFDNVVVYAREV